MNALLFATLIACVYGFFVSFAGNKLIDFLFMRKLDYLTFQEDMTTQGKNRKIFLFVLSAILAFFMAALLKPFALVFALIFAFGMIIATRTDMEQHLIFDILMFPYAVLGIIAVFAMNLPTSNHIIAAAAAFLGMFVLAIITRGGIGGGDIKLLAVIGIWLGQELTLLTFMAGTIVGGIYSLFLLLIKKAGRKEAFPYGPFFAVSAVIILALYGFQY